MQAEVSNDFIDESRYSRLNMVKSLNMEKIRHAKIMVIGAGAVGNEVIKNLALFGVGITYIIDFDDIERTNLSRSVLFREKDTKKKSFKAIVAAKRAKEINPDCNFIGLNADICNEIGLGLFRRMDAIICCVDNRFARLMISRYSFWLNKSWINCGILDVEGMCTVYKPGINDYESELSQVAWKNIRYRLGCPDVARAFFKEGSTPTTPVSASIVGGLLVSEALKLIHNYDEQLLAGVELRFNLSKNEFFLTEGREINEFSESNKRIQYVNETNLSSDSKLKDLWKIISNHIPSGKFEIVLRDALVTQVERESDNKEFNVMVKESGLSSYLDKNGFRDLGSEHLHNRIFIKNKVAFISPDSGLDNYKLKQLGIPAFDIVEVRSANHGVLNFELTADSNKYNI